MAAAPFLVQWALRSSILITGGMLAIRVLRIKDASRRLATSTAILWASLAIPIFTVAIHQSKLVPIPVSTPRAKAASVDSAENLLLFNETPPPRIRPGGSAVVPRFELASVALLIYGTVAAALLMRMCMGLLMGHLLVRRSRPTAVKAGPVEVRESDRLASPVAMGIMRPVIVLPSDWRDWGPAKLDAVLAHERAHIERHDPAVLLATIHRALLWHTPLSWILRRSIVRLAEEASDDAAIAISGDRTTYAEVLLEFMRRGVRRPGWIGVEMARYGSQEGRITRILESTSLSRPVTRWSLAAILVLGSPLVYVTRMAAPQKKPLNFEVASVKPATPPPGVTVNGNTVMGPRRDEMRALRESGGPGTNDPGRVHYPLISLKGLLLRAYDSYYEIKAPGFADTTTVQLDATMPADTTKEQFREMLANLIAERFQLKYHVESHEVSGYALVVAKGGAKLKEVEAPADPTAPPAARPRERDAQGFPVPPKGSLFFFSAIEGHRARITSQQKPIANLVDGLHTMLRAPITDETGLKGYYDYTVTYAGGFGADGPLADGVSTASEPSDLPDIFNALQSQIGLRLEPRKIPVEILVVDYIEKTPSGN